MKSSQPLGESENVARDTQVPLTGIIRRQVLRSLGRPGNLLAVQVCPVGAECYRVNVVVGCNLASSRIADSFFLTVDAGGSILTSSPAIVRGY